MSNLNSLKSLVGNAEFTASLSPATCLDIVTGRDSEGWANYLTVSVKDRLVSPSGRMYQVIGFTTSNTLICVQVGLDIDPAIRFVELTGEGLDYADKPVYDWQHKCGLIAFN